MKQEANQINKTQIPSYVTHVTSTLEKAGYEAYIVGGCVRDLLLGRTPKDWDITTNAVPEEIIPLFEKVVYENKFGTVAVIFELKPDVTHVTSGIVSRETNPSISHETDIPESYKLKANHLLRLPTPRRGQIQQKDRGRPHAP